MRTITGGFTLKSGEDISKNKKFMTIFETSGMFTPFDERDGKSTFTNKEAKKVKLKKVKLKKLNNT